MIRSRQRLSAIAMGVALALVLAGAAHAQSYPNHKPLRGDYPGSHEPDASIWVATQRHASHTPLRGDYPGSYAPVSVASAAYANHTPLRGQYPGSYISSATAPAGGSGDAFDWADAGVGAAAMLGLVLMFTAAKASGARARQRYAA